MNFIYSAEATKQQVFESVRKYLVQQGYSIETEEFRPWGGFMVIDDRNTKKFIKEFFPEERQLLEETNKLSPKILIVEGGERLSWQFHIRRAEFWKSIGADAGVVTSMTDEPGEVQLLPKGKIIRLKQGERHRLVGLNGWGIIAEIWEHTDQSNESDEEDIVRLQDDYGR